MEQRKTEDTYLVTGNLKHYPADPRVMNVTAFLEKAKRELADFR